MKTLFLAAALAALPFAPALAVDIVNEDQAAYVAVVTIGEQATEVEIAPGATVSGVCEACLIEIDGSEPIEAEGDSVVTIREGGAAIRG